MGQAGEHTSKRPLGTLSLRSPAPTQLVDRPDVPCAIGCLDLEPVSERDSAWIARCAWQDSNLRPAD
jgi:hypothetical protein